MLLSNHPSLLNVELLFFTTDISSQDSTIQTIRSIQNKGGTVSRDEFRSFIHGFAPLASIGWCKYAWLWLVAIHVICHIKGCHVSWKQDKMFKAHGQAVICLAGNVCMCTGSASRNQYLQLLGPGFAFSFTENTGHQLVLREVSNTQI